jgi:hypothetical protein
VTAAQGWLVLLLGWGLDGFSFPILPPLVQVAAASLLLGAVSLFWAVRLRTAGAVWLASTVTLCAMGKWFFFNPIPPRYGEAFGRFLPGPEMALAWLGSAGVLAAGSVLFFLYAQRRLRRPELIIS